MINISNYIFEKLKVNKDSKTESSKYYPSESVLDFAKEFFNRMECYSYKKGEVVSKQYKTIDKLMPLWLAIMIYSKSTPYLSDNKKTVNSYPGNYGKELIDKMIEIDVKPDQIISEWEKIDFKDNILPVSIEGYYKDKIENLVKLTGLNYKITVKSFIPIDGDHYTKEGKELLDKRNQYIVIPFEIEANGKKAICEISFMLISYYTWNINGKKYGTINSFLSGLIEELGK